MAKANIDAIFERRCRHADMEDDAALLVDFIQSLADQGKTTAKEFNAFITARKAKERAEERAETARYREMAHKHPPGRRGQHCYAVHFLPTQNLRGFHAIDQFMLTSKEHFDLMAAGKAGDVCPEVPEGSPLTRMVGCVERRLADTLRAEGVSEKGRAVYRYEGDPESGGKWVLVSAVVHPVAMEVEVRA